MSADAAVSKFSLTDFNAINDEDGVEVAIKGFGWNTAFFGAVWAFALLYHFVLA